MIDQLIVGTDVYLSNEYLRYPTLGQGAYVGQDPVAYSNMKYLKTLANQDLYWVDMLIDGDQFNYQPVAPDAPVVSTDILYVDDPDTDYKLCFLEEALYNSYQSIWDGSGIIDQAQYDADRQADWQAAWPQHDSNLSAFLYGVTLTKSEGMTAGQRFGLYNDALAILGLEPDFTYDPPRGPIEAAVHQYAVNITGA